MKQRRMRTSLNGDWQMYLGDDRYGTIPVPSSYPPVGVATLKRTLGRVSAGGGGRLFLVFEGVANEAEVSLAGHHLGHMVAFGRHAFDVTDLSAREDPELAVTVRDLHAEFGNTPGWETYGGIIRDVFLERVPDVHIADTYCRPTLADKDAELTVELELANALTEPAAGRVHVVLFDGEGTTIAARTSDHTLEPGTTTTTVTIPVARPHLWSPEGPYLYRVAVALQSASGRDEVEKRVGFRRVEARGRRFYLNGRALFLKGVCRHDTWPGQGYTLTIAQMREDLQAIKELGANYIRLVHYPHHPAILDIADEIGLFVTEEPGFWNVRLDAENMPRPKEVALEIMRRTILRDRSHPCVFAWLLGNECWPDRAYLNEGKRLCNTLDPGRFVAFSHLRNEDSRMRPIAPYRGWEPDFYDYHPYGEESDLYRSAMRDFDDKPLVFGEWGGWWVQHNDWLLKEIGAACAAAAHAPADAAEQLAGIAYWEWADMRQYHRGYPACEMGVLTEGLVTEDRRRKHAWEVMQAIFQAIDAGPPPRTRSAHFGRIAPAVTFPADLVPLDLPTSEDSGSQARAWAVADPEYEDWRALPDGLDTGAFRLAQATTGRPLLLSPLSPCAQLDVHRRISEVWLIGLGTLTEGFPVAGRLNDDAVRISAVAQDLAPSLRLRQGRHVARQNVLYQGSRINPVTLEARLLFEWIVDPDAEIRQVRAHTWRLPEPLYCERLDIELVDGHSAIVFHAVSVR